MSNLILNIRFGEYHLQLTKNWRVRWSHNPYQAEARKSDKDWRWFEIM